MKVSNNQMRSLRWAAVLAVCIGIFVVLSLRVHAVNSEVLLKEREIVSLKKEILLLETEFETRSSQRQLANWNTVEFGFEAPRADQYLEGERQLASLGQPRGPDAPSPIRVARAEPVRSARAAETEREMVSPISGEKLTLAAAGQATDTTGAFANAFGDFLSDASPITAANAQSGAGQAVTTTLGQDATGGRE